MKFITLILTLILPIKLFSAENSAAAVKDVIIIQSPFTYCSLKKTRSDAKIYYKVLNYSDKQIIINKYCTIELSAISGNYIYEFKDNGTDAFKKISASDIVVLKQGEEMDLTISVAVLKEKEFVTLIRSDESGNYWITDPIKTTSSIELKSQYKNTLDKSSIGKILGMNIDGCDIPRIFSIKKVNINTK